uniref:RCC1-like domain-containing protein n=1 Tax=Eucampia antarctica TaxID=49252 RepID=A0A7S2R0I9_9STRA|mmetsp:Transcript_11339/g.10854  ORF Transcript_11339/g.10854 Transcript_11339/m.10854 type:complete len:455 (+) Transcript_11339:123-1487(+)
MASGLRHLGKVRNLCRYGGIVDNGIRSLSSSSVAVKSDEKALGGNEDSSAAQMPYSLFMWGTNQKGSIPLPDILEEGKSGSSTSNLLKSKRVYDHPMQIDLEKAYGIDNKSVTIKSMHCGPLATACVLSDGRCFLHGDNSFGQLGNGDLNDALVPEIMSPPESSSLHLDQVESISLGSQFSAVIDKKGDLYTFGYGGSVMKEGIGNLGHGDAESYYTPTLVQSLVEDGVYAKQVAVGVSHMTVLTTEGEVLTAGAGSYGRLGNLETYDQLFLEPIELLQSEKIQHVANGKEFSAALTTEGIVFCWGRNDKGQCGTGAGLSVDVYAMEPLPLPVEGVLEGRKVVKVDTGYAHAAAITEQGELFMWGSGLHHQPELMTDLLGKNIVDLACGQNYTIALDDQGQIHTFGKGKTGVLGLANETSLNQPTHVEGLSKYKVAKLSAGWSHVACLVQPSES